MFSFAGVTAGLQANGAAAPNTGNTFAGFLTGYVSQGLFTTELTSWLPRSSIHSFYFQDDFKLAPALTLRTYSSAIFSSPLGLYGFRGYDMVESHVLG